MRAESYVWLAPSGEAYVGRNVGSRFPHVNGVVKVANPGEVVDVAAIAAAYPERCGDATELADLGLEDLADHTEYPKVKATYSLPKPRKKGAKK